MRHLKLLILLMGSSTLIVHYIMAKMHTAYIMTIVPSTKSQYSQEQLAEIEAFHAEVAVLDYKRSQTLTIGDRWRLYPEDILKQMLAVKVDAMDLADRLGCCIPDPDIVCTKLLNGESQLKLELENHDIRTIRKHAEEAAPLVPAEFETGLVVVDKYLKKHQPPPFFRDLAYHGTGYLKMIVLREAIERLAAFFRFGPRVNVLGNF